MKDREGGFEKMGILIQTSSKKYPVYVGRDALSQLRTHLQKSNYTKILVISDEIVGKLHLNTLNNWIGDAIEKDYYQVPAGEKAKQFSVYEACLTHALTFGLDRKSCIIAFGGGAVGDLAGFVAATFMRGIPFIQVPTTILAHDSAVGGKTGINHPLGKNMIGSFHQPDGVFYYTEFLHTLPDSERRSGFAEAVKHAFIADPEFLHFLMNNVTDLNAINEQNLIKILTRGIEIKAQVVSQDEKELGLRAILNFGHTLGHVLEASAGYGKITHGEAVMTGMVYALYISKLHSHLTFDLQAFELWIRQLGYRSEIPEGFDFKEALEAMKRDKKSVASKPRFVLLEEVGKPVVNEIDDNLLKQAFSDFLATSQL